MGPSQELPVPLELGRSNSARVPQVAFSSEKMEQTYRSVESRRDGAKTFEEMGVSYDGALYRQENNLVQKAEDASVRMHKSTIYGSGRIQEERHVQSTIASRSQSHQNLEAHSVRRTSGHIPQTQSKDSLASASPPSSTLNLSVQGKPLLQFMSSFDSSQQIFILVFLTSVGSILTLVGLYTVFHFLRASTAYVFTTCILGGAGYGALCWKRMEVQEGLAKEEIKMHALGMSAEGGWGRSTGGGRSALDYGTQKQRLLGGGSADEFISTGFKRGRDRPERKNGKVDFVVEEVD